MGTTEDSAATTEAPVSDVANAPAGVTMLTVLDQGQGAVCGIDGCCSA